MLPTDIHELLGKVKDKKQLLGFLQRHMTDKRSERFEEVLQFRTRYLTVAVEDVYQERNASAIVRTADCFGIQDVHIIENFNEYKLSEGIAKGSEKWVDVHIYDRAENNSLDCINQLQEKGYRIIASSPHNSQRTIPELEIDTPTAIFLGGEKGGLSGTVLDQAEEFVTIPMFGFTESFNLSVAGALILQELTRKLHDSGLAWQLSEEEKSDLRLEWTIKTVASSKELIKKFIQSGQGI